MNKILIVSPHFPPSNLAAVHRSRLFAQHLPSFGWEPIILAVHENYYEEKLDFNLKEILPKGLRIEKVKALKTTKPRIIGDIGIRGFYSLYKRAKELIKEEAIDFLYIPIPSFYVSILGRMLHSSTGIKYGIDYIDPWVHQFPGSNKIFSRHWFSTQIAKFLEPIAVKKASLITGVAEGYYKGVQDRNPQLATTCLFGAMPYGGEERDHKMVKELKLEPYLFAREKGKIKMIYAGAMLPKAYTPLEAIFKNMAINKTQFANVEFHFIGTGKLPNDSTSYNIKPLAEKYGLWQEIVFEYPQRFPYLDVLVHLNIADGVFILGSTEPHYTPSKVYQGVLSGKSIMAVLHKESSAVKVIREAKAGVVLAFNGEFEVKKIEAEFTDVFTQYLSFRLLFSEEDMDTSSFKQYSANGITRTLAKLLNASISETVQQPVLQL